MVVNLLNGYPDFIGARQAFAGYGSGPASYVTGGDPLSLSNPRLFIDVVFGGALALSGNYYVRSIVNVVGERSTWSLQWFVANVATGTVGAQVSSATNLSAEQVQIGGFCGQY